MFSRGVNEDVLKSEGHNAPSPRTETEQANAEQYKMRFWYNFADPHHKDHRRPIVDVSSPFNVLDEAHQARRYGVQKVAAGFLSLNEFIGTHEQVPYTESHHTSEIFRLWMAGLNVWYMNYFIARAQVSGNASGNPRTRFAWTIAMAMGMIRVNIAGLIGVGGYFYSYEYLYTHGPKAFRIHDPTPNGWKRAWDEGQECYLSRAAASIFPALGYAFFMGRWKKASFWFMLTLCTGLYYEYARRNILSGSRLFYSYLANQDSQRQAAWGSLAPNLKHRVDPDTNRNESVAQYKFFRITSGTMQDTIWCNCTHETQPLARGGMRIPNPYFNWRKAPQNYNAKPWRVKNDMWEMPQPPRNEEDGAKKIRFHAKATPLSRMCAYTARAEERRHSVGDEARQRNGIAVQKMFHRSNAQRLHAGAQISCGRDERATVGTTGDRYDGREATGMSFRVPRTSAAALVGIVGGAGRGEQPAWSNPDPCRNPTRAPLGVSSCLTDQIDLAEHMDTQPSAQPQLLSTRAAPLRMKERNGASRSCFLLGVQKARHAHGIEAMPADSALTRYEANKAQWKAYHHQQAILRYERTLPRRRVVDPYVHLTGAQVSVSLAVPNAYTADRLVERNGGRWILDNSHRQQLYKGAPVMTRIMQGEFYHQGAERRAAGVPRYDLLAKNRRDVRVTSAVNQAERQRRQSLPCHCICSK